MNPTKIEEETIHILLVDDDAGGSSRLQRMLRDFEPRFRVRIASSPEEAMKGDRRETQIILTDLGVAESQGMQRFFRCKELWPDLPILVLSGVGNEETAKEAVQNGAQDYLVKSEINGRALRRAVLHAIDRHGAYEERRELVRELEQSRKLEAIGQLAAGVAHEINTPTQYVSDNTRFLRDAVTSMVSALERVRDYVRRGLPARPEDLAVILEKADIEYLLEEVPKAIQQSLDGLAHIARIVLAMKEFSHPASDEKTPADMNKLLETTILVASNEWKYVATVETDYQEGLPAVECLPGEVNQVFLNLVVNAAHAILEATKGKEVKGRIRVETRALGDQVEVRIEDTGCGIPLQNRARVFDPFFTTKEVGKGTGQGLAIAYNVIVNKHGGSIDFETDASGTTFIVRLPIHSTAQAA